MARPLNFLFCNYDIFFGQERLDAQGEFALVSENQGGEFEHGRLREGVQPQTLCTDPIMLSVQGFRAHAFEIGYKPGIRVRQEYDAVRKSKTRQIERDAHTKFGQIVSVPDLRAMAVRDRTSDDTIGATATIGALRSLVKGVAGDGARLTVSHASDEDVAHALGTWRVEEYRYTVRPLNPTGGDLARLRTRMYEAENIAQESGVVKAPYGEGLRVADGTIGQTYDLYKDGYGQIGVRGQTVDGHTASIPKLPFSQDKSTNLRYREEKPRLLRIAFERESEDDDLSKEVAAALVQFYNR